MRRARPLRNPLIVYEISEDGSALLIAPLATQGRGVLGAMAKKLGKPDTKKFDLDPVGAMVWQLCDGQHTFDGIAKRLRDRFKMNRLEAEAALGAFLQTLVKKRLISIGAAGKGGEQK